MYGERDDPYAVLTRLSNILEQSLSPAEVLPAIASAIGTGAQGTLPGNPIQRNGEEEVVAIYGRPQPETITFPMVYQSETVGTLQVAPRARGEEFSSADRRLIENIARQAGSRGPGGAPERRVDPLAS